MAQQIGQAAAAAMDLVNQDSQQLATTSSKTAAQLLEEDDAEISWLNALPDRVDGDDLERVKAIVQRPEQRLPACTDDQFAKYIRIMQTTLKAKADDDMTGKILLRAYHSRLGHYPTQAIQYLAQRCVDTMIFFPTIVECHDVLKEWVNPLGRPSRTAALIMRKRSELKFDDVCNDLRTGKATQDQVDALPETWKSILFEQGYFRFDVEANKYIIRERKSDVA